MAPSPENKPLGFDECIAIAVAFGAIATIFTWSVSQKDSPFTLQTQPPVTPSSSPNSQNPNATQPNGTDWLSLPTSLNPNPTPTSQPSKFPQRTIGPVIIPQPPNSAVIPPATATASPANTVPFVAVAPPIPKATSSPTPKAVPVSPNAETSTVRVPPIEFDDVPDTYWAHPFIKPLTERKIIAGVSEKKFEPEESITRAEFAAILEGISQKEVNQNSVVFKDVKADYWANPSIDKAVKTGFMEGYPGKVFQPEQTVSRVQVLVALAKGLNLKPSTQTAKTLRIYQDRRQIPAWARSRVAAATEAGLVVNYPKRSRLNPNQPATRADVAAMIYQASVKLGKEKPINSDYIVKK